jgi:N,N'-diacetyllegionaminate synthase
MRKTIKFGKKILTEDSGTYIIAEAGINHSGDFSLAEKMIEAASNTGVDAIKFQAFNTEERFKNDPAAIDFVKPAELSFTQLKDLAEICKKNNLTFFSTAFDSLSVKFLMDINVPVFKVASCDIANERLLNEIAETNVPTIISSGTANIDEIRRALDIFTKKNSSMALLHCVSSYPLADENANLKAIHNLKAELGCLIGYSDHSKGIDIPISAVFAGAKIIEKHYTLSKELKGIDWEVSANPDEFIDMVKKIRQADLILGNGFIGCSDCEQEELEYRRQIRDSQI